MKLYKVMVACVRSETWVVTRTASAIRSVTRVTLSDTNLYKRLQGSGHGLFQDTTGINLDRLKKATKTSVMLEVAQPKLRYCPKTCLEHYQ
jgi:hypothetical protein